MIVFDAKELRNLEANGNTACCVEDDFCWLVHFCDHLLGVDEHASLVT